MKIKNILKYSGLVALVLTMAVGCASKPVEEEPVEEVVETATAEQAQAAINAAKLAIEKAEAAGLDMSGPRDLLRQAEEALAAGEYQKAIDLANQARRDAERALAAHEAELARQAAKPADDTYTVVRGDNLWNISGKSSIYGNPYQWPLIYKANRDKIKDADLIHPDQVLTINRSASSAEIDAAVQHAKTRGAWSIGVVEASDEAYLAR